MVNSAQNPDQDRFRYAAEALPISGSVLGQNISLDRCMLPPDGGFAHLRWQRSRFPGPIEVGYAYAEVQGQPSQTANAWETTAFIALENCNVREVLTIGRMSATLVSSQPVNGDLPSFSIQNPIFGDVRVAGVLVQFDLDLEPYSQPRRYDEFSDLRPDRKSDGENGRITTTFIRRMEAQFAGSGRLDGNVISIPNFGRIRLATVVVEPHQCALGLIRVEFDGAIQGLVDLGRLAVNGEYDRTERKESSVQEDAVPESTNLDEEEEKEVLEELNQWVNTHPYPNEPFLFFMGNSLTPVRFLHEVEDKTSFGISFLRFLSDQSKRFDERPRDAIRRAVDANQHE